MDAPDSVFRLPVSEGARLVLVLLWRYAGADREPVVWPSAARLAEQTGMAVRSVERVLRVLREAGAIKRCRRPATAHSSGPAWMLIAEPTPTEESVLADHPDSSVGTTPTRLSVPPRPVGRSDRTVGATPTEESPPPDPAIGGIPTQRSDRTNREPTKEPTREPTTLFELAPLPAKRAPKGKPKPKPKAGCTDEQWAVVVEAWAEARELGGMPAQWGRMRDNPTNRKHAGRIFADGYTEADLRAVMRHIGQGLARGTHEPRWAVLEHVARTMERYVQEAVAADQRPQPGRYADRGAVCYEPVEHDPPPEVYEAEIAAAFERAGQ